MSKTREKLQRMYAHKHILDEEHECAHCIRNYFKTIVEIKKNNKISLEFYAKTQKTNKKMKESVKVEKRKFDEPIRRAEDDDDEEKQAETARTSRVEKNGNGNGHYLDEYDLDTSDEEVIN